MQLFSLFFKEPILFFAIVFIFLFVLSVHECSHALAAFWLGDMTAKRANRLTLNPLAHIDWLGFFMLIFAGFGWGKPVPFNPYNLRGRQMGPVIVACAGPLSNFLIGAVFALAYRFLVPVLGPMNLLSFVLQYGAYISFLLGFFNLIPIPPLDGSKVLLAILYDEKYRTWRYWLETQGTYLLLILVLFDSFSGFGIFSWLSGLAGWMFGYFISS